MSGSRRGGSRSREDRSAEAVAVLAACNGGIVTAAEAIEAGFANCRLTEAVRAGYLERVERGVYCIPEIWKDRYYVFRLRYPRGIFSDESALVLHGLVDWWPDDEPVMNFPRGYNASSARRSGVEVRTCPIDLFDLGLVTVLTPYGNPVFCYDVERSLCDVLRSRSVVDAEVILPAFERYLASKERDLEKFVSYAVKLDVLFKVAHYVLRAENVEDDEEFKPLALALLEKRYGNATEKDLRKLVRRLREEMEREAILAADHGVNA